jgi:ribosomal protein S18 acetylase RimI-like enzyme
MPKRPLGLRFRSFVESDLDELRPWLEATGLGLPAALGRAGLGRRLASDPRILCRSAVARSGELVGFVRLDVGPDRVADLTLIVAPGQRRQGIGAQLLEEALRVARGAGIRRLLAVIQDSNERAQAFFRGQGFHASGVYIPGFVHLARIVHRTDSAVPLEIIP